MGPRNRKKQHTNDDSSSNIISSLSSASKNHLKVDEKSAEKEPKKEEILSPIEDFTCPITYNVYSSEGDRRPVLVVQSKQIYSLAGVRDWFFIENKNVDPITKAKLIRPTGTFEEELKKGTFICLIPSLVNSFSSIASRVLALKRIESTLSPENSETMSKLKKELEIEFKEEIDKRAKEKEKEIEAREEKQQVQKLQREQQRLQLLLQQEQQSWRFSSTTCCLSLLLATGLLTGAGIGWHRQAEAWEELRSCKADNFENFENFKQCYTQSGKVDSEFYKCSKELDKCLKEAAGYQRQWDWFSNANNNIRDKFSTMMYFTLEMLQLRGNPEMEEDFLSFLRRLEEGPEDNQKLSSLSDENNGSVLKKLKTL